MKEYIWEYCKRQEIEEHSKANALVLLPVGSVEQHGEHLPVGCDELMAEYMAKEVAKKMNNDGYPCVVAPTIKVANSTHHMHFYGTMTLRPETFMHVLEDYIDSIVHHGFHKIIIINGHGGNNSPLSTSLITINQKTNFPVYWMEYFMADQQNEKEVLETQPTMNHACESETSYMLYAYPELVGDIGNAKGEEGECTSYEDEGILHTFHYMDAHTSTGVKGQGYAGTYDKGKSMVEANVKAMCKIFEDESIYKVRV